MTCPRNFDLFFHTILTSFIGQIMAGVLFFVNSLTSISCILWIKIICLFFYLFTLFFILLPKAVKENASVHFILLGQLHVVSFHILFSLSWTVLQRSNNFSRVTICVFLSNVLTALYSKCALRKHMENNEAYAQESDRAQLCVVDLSQEYSASTLVVVRSLRSPCFEAISFYLENKLLLYRVAGSNYPENLYRVARSSYLENKLLLLYSVVWSSYLETSFLYIGFSVLSSIKQVSLIQCCWLL